MVNSFFMHKNVFVVQNDKEIYSNLKRYNDVQNLVGIPTLGKEDFIIYCQILFIFLVFSH